MVGTDTSGGSAVPTSACAIAPLVAVAPLLLGFIASLAVAGGVVVGWRPFWPEPRLNVAEAAGLNNAGEVVRLIVDEHQDPNRRWPMRAGIIDDGVLVRSGIVDHDSVMMTPLEAAIAIRREPLIPVLLRHGAVIPEHGPERAALICRAMAVGADRIVEMLVKTDDGSDPRGSCPPPAN